MTQRPYQRYEDYSQQVQMEFPRGYDFLSLLSFQQEFHGSATCYWLKATHSKAVTEATVGSRETAVGNCRIRQNPVNAQRTDIISGSPIPFEHMGRDSHRSISTLNSIAHDGLMALRGEEAVISEIGLLYEIPPHLASEPLFEDANYVAHEMSSRGNRGRQAERQLGVSTFDPYSTIKDHLERRGKDITQVEKRLRSHLTTRGLITDTGVTHAEMAAADLLEDVLREIHYADFQNGGHWDFTRDIGIPFELQAESGHDVTARLYQLQQNHEVMTG